MSSVETIGLSPVPEVVIVILNWNSHQDTIAAVASVLKMDYPTFRVVIVDNGSIEDPTQTLAAVLSERVSLVRSPENVGFTGGCNLGIDTALQLNASYVWLLNSDAITEVGTLSSLVRVAEADPGIGLVSPIIATLQNPEKLMNAGGLYRADPPYYDTTKKIEVAREWARTSPEGITLLGTALLIRVALIRKIGKLDDDLFAYFEDADYSVRSIKAGYRNALDFDATVYHLEKSTAHNAHDVKPHYWYYMARNEIRFWKKYSKSVHRLKRLWWHYGFQLNNLNLLTGNEPARQAIMAGLWHGLTNRTGAYRAGLRSPTAFARLVEFHRRRRSTSA